MTEEKLEEPTPDGRVELVRLDRRAMAHNQEYLHTIHLKDIEYRQDSAIGVMICYKSRHVIIPWHDIIEMRVFHNSDEYRQKYDAWLDQEHQPHLDSERDEKCPRCNYELMREQIMAGSMMLLPESDGRN